jgi:hypothetical protein
MSFDKINILLTYIYIWKVVNIIKTSLLRFYSDTNITNDKKALLLLIIYLAHKVVIKCLYRRMPSSEICCRVTFVTTYVSEKSIALIIRVERISEVRKTLAESIIRCHHR